MKVVNKPIEVLAFNKVDGTILPFRMRLKTEEGELIAYDLKILTKDKTNEYGKDYIKYTCTIDKNDYEMMCEIRYYKESMKWTLFKV